MPPLPRTEIPSTDSNSPAPPAESSPLITSFAEAFAIHGFRISVTAPVLPPEPACATYSIPPGPKAKPRGLCNPSRTTVYGPAANAEVMLKSDSKRHTPNEATTFFMDILLVCRPVINEAPPNLKRTSGQNSTNLGGAILRA